MFDLIDILQKKILKFIHQMNDSFYESVMYNFGYKKN